MKVGSGTFEVKSNRQPPYDSAEGLAIDAVFRRGTPPASSTKAFTGHTLGASGGVEAVFSTLAASSKRVSAMSCRKARAP